MMAESESAATTTNPLDLGAADADASGPGSVILLAGAPPSAAGADEVDVEAGLKDGTLSAAEAIVHMHRQMARQKRTMAGVEGWLGGGGAPLAEALVRKVPGPWATAGRASCR
jgi:hypothetical protein